MKGPVTIVAMSDTHGLQPDVPNGDILIHSGDFTNYGHINEVWEFVEWFSQQPHEHKVLVAGNHDFALEKNPELHPYWFDEYGITYLQDKEVTIRGLRIFGTPWQPQFTKERLAFNQIRFTETKPHWKKLPKGLDILVTHGPPLGYGDKGGHTVSHVGCADQLAAIKKNKPKVVCCGHVHEGYGFHVTNFGTMVVNAAVAKYDYTAKDPLVFTMVGELK